MLGREWNDEGDGVRASGIRGIRKREAAEQQLRLELINILRDSDVPEQGIQRCQLVSDAPSCTIIQLLQEHGHDFLRLATRIQEHGDDMRKHQTPEN